MPGWVHNMMALSWDTENEQVGICWVHACFPASSKPSLIPAVIKLKLLLCLSPLTPWHSALSQAMAVKHANQRLTGPQRDWAKINIFSLKAVFLVRLSTMSKLTTVYINCPDNASQPELLKLQHPFSFLAPSVHPYDLVKTCPSADQFVLCSPLLISVYYLNWSYNYALKIYLLHFTIFK